MKLVERHIQNCLFIILFLVLSSCGVNKIKIIVPVGYVGDVNLIRSNVFSNQLTLDTNGIGYLTQTTFDNLKLEPEVYDALGKDLSANCVGYNSSTFWAIGKSNSPELKCIIKSMSFEIVPDSLIGKKQYYFTDLCKLVDISKIKFNN